MTDSPNHRSVRVEVDGGGDVVGADAPLVEARGATSGHRALVVVLAIGLLVLLLILLAQADGEAVSEATPPDTSGVPNAEEAEGQSSTSALAQLVFEPTTGARELKSVARTPLGLLGLTSLTDQMNHPVLVQSSDGATWEEVEFLHDGSLPQGPSANRQPLFEKLVRSNDGYAMLATISGPDVEDDQPKPTTQVVRLVSVDGLSWSVDANFMSFDHSGSFSRIIAHGAGAFVVLASPQPRANEVLQDLLDAQVVEDASVGEVCTAARADTASLAVRSCSGDDELLLVAEDTRQPDRFDDLVTCAVYLDTTMRDPAFWLVPTGGSPTELPGATSLLSTPIIADDGRVVAIDFPRALNANRLACSDLVDMGVEALPSVVVWDPRDPTRPIRHPIPPGIDAASLLSVGAEPALSGTNLLIVTGSALTTAVASVDLDSGAWEDVVTLPVRPDDETSVKLSANRSELVYLDSGRVTVIEIMSGRVKFRDSNIGNRPGFPQIIYADDQVVLARGARSIFKIDTP